TMDFPTASPTMIEQERAASPSICTVQAPHRARPHPYFVPVRSRKSRIAQRSGISELTSSSTVRLFTVKVCMATFLVRAKTRSHRAAHVRCDPLLQLLDELGMGNRDGGATSTWMPAPQDQLVILHMVDQRRAVAAAVVRLVLEHATEVAARKPLPEH